MTAHDPMLDGITTYVVYDEGVLHPLETVDPGDIGAIVILAADLPALIARVREHERGKCEANGPYFTSVVHECCERVQTERAAALDAARDAVASVAIGHSWPEEPTVHALAAIDALREKP